MTEVGPSALLVIDVQNDFCAGGALAVKNGDNVIPPLNRMIEWSAANGLPVYASRDWHPADTKHFKKYGGVWPVHCVQRSRGAEFHPDLRLTPKTAVITTGDTRESEGYSAFEGHTDTGVTLAHALREKGIRHLYIGGLATDYCVRHSALDARKAGFEVTLLTDAVAGVNLSPDDSKRAMEEMAATGVRFATTEEILSSDSGGGPSSAPTATR